MGTRIGRKAADHEMFAGAVQGYARKHGIGVAGQAAMIGQEIYGRERSQDWLYKLCEGHRAIPVEVWRFVQSYTGDNAMVQRFCRDAGGVFVPIRAIDSTQTNDALQAIQAAASMIESMIQAFADGIIEPHELVELTEKGNRNIEMTAGAMQLAEKMVKYPRENIHALSRDEKRERM